MATHHAEPQTSECACQGKVDEHNEWQNIPAIDFSRPRLVDWRRRMVAEIPLVKGRRHLKHELERLSLPELLPVYLNFRARRIRPQPRQVFYHPDFWASPGAMEHGGDVLAIEREIRSGADLTSRLSHLALTDGFAPRAASADGRNHGVEWSDKDFALNAFGVHHLHVAGCHAGQGIVRRADALLYAAFGADQCALLMFGNHKSFDDGSLARAYASFLSYRGMELKGVRAGKPSDVKEVTVAARYGLSSFITTGDKVVPGPLLGGTGLSIRYMRYARAVLRIVRQLELRLDHSEEYHGLFGPMSSGWADPTSFEWDFDHTRFVLREHGSGTVIHLHNGFS